jgi:putative ABC transport system permease protein
MRPLLWRLVEWHLARELTHAQVASTLGDLTEDFGRRQRAAGSLRAALWVIRETLSVSAAYRSRARDERRHSRRMIMSASWMGDARFAARRLTRQPAASLASVFTLACAIAAGAVTWSLLSALLLNPLPVEAPESLVAVGGRLQMRNGGLSALRYGHVYTVYNAVRESEAFERVAAGGAMSLLVTDAAGAMPRPRTVYFATHDFFETLGVRIPRGRDFIEQDDRRGVPLAAIVSDRYWRHALEADPGVVGQALMISNQRATIIGVAPPRFRGLTLAEAPDIYLPLHTIGDVEHTYANPFADPAGTTPTAWVTIVARLRAHPPAEHAARLNSLPIGARRGTTFELTPVNIAAIPEAARGGMVQFTRLLAATVALLLLIGCLTVGMLLLVRTEARRSEFAMCLALGGSRASLTRGVMAEGFLLTLGGVVLAVPVASWLFSGLRAFQLPGGVDIELLELSPDRGTSLALAGVAMAALVLIAVVGGVFGLSASVSDVLRARAGSTPPVTRRRTRTALVGAQVAIALVLMAGAGLFLRSLVKALTVNAGFDAGRIVTGTLALAPYGYTPARAAQFFDELRDRLDQGPAIDAVSLMRRQGGMTPVGRITVNGVARQFPSLVAYTVVDERYFSTIGLSILEGRDFSRYDTATSPLVVIVSESYARALAGDDSPVGYRITETSARPGEPPGIAEVIGVVPDVITNVKATEPLVTYYSIAQRQPVAHGTIVMRARSDAGAVVREAVNTVRRMDPRLDPEPLMMSIQDQLGQQMGVQRLGSFVLGTLGSIAFLLTMLGAYVLAESMSAGRRREFGIRAALGARRAHLAALVLGETVQLVGVGLLAGLALAWVGATAIRAFLFRVDPLDSPTLAGVSAALLGVALIVSLKPAIDAARVDLVHTLRDE